MTMPESDEAPEWNVALAKYTAEDIKRAVMGLSEHKSVSYDLHGSRSSVDFSFWQVGRVA